MKDIQQLQEQINSLQKELDLLKRGFKVGDWVITRGYCKEFDSMPLKISRIDGGTYCYFYNSRFVGSNFSYMHIVRHATKEEIQSHLTKEAERRGFKVGVKIHRDFFYKGVYLGETEIRRILEGQEEYYPEEDAFEYNGVFVYRSGKWATIIKDKLMIDKYEVEFRKDKTEILVGGNFYYKQSIENILQLSNFKALIMHDCNGKEIRVEKEKIQQIYERLK